MAEPLDVLERLIRRDRLRLWGCVHGR
jgi:hypothetical protein